MRRGVRREESSLYKHEDLSSIPSNQVVPVSISPDGRARDKRIAGVSRQTALSETMSSRFSQRFCLKNVGQRAIKQDSNSLLHSLHIKHTHTHTHARTHARAPQQKKKVGEKEKMEEKGEGKLFLY